jgi:peroxiredoxin Q/BCP
MPGQMPTPGSAAPGFEANDQHGAAIRLAGLTGKWVVLYFYPKDNTPGCTKEACSFRDANDELADAGAVVLGVSGDSATSHEKFAGEFKLPFSLLVDKDHTIARAYGAWGLKKNYGREYEGIIRSTFLIGPDGKVAKVWPRVKPADHGEEVLAWLKQNASSS